MHEASIGSSRSISPTGWRDIAVNLPWVMAVQPMVCRNDEDDFSEENPEEFEEEEEEEEIFEEEEEEYEEYELDEELDEDDEDWDEDDEQE